MTGIARRLQRILLMVPYIQNHPGIRVTELAAYLGCPAETILADLDAVLLCGVPPYLPNDYIGVVLDGDRIHLSFAEHFKRPVNLTFEEALSLNLALRRLPLTRGKHDAAQKLRKKIISLLPQGSRGMWRDARRRLNVGAARKALQERMAVLDQAIESRREVRMEYFTVSRDAMTERDVRPYGLIEHNGEWYLVGYCMLRERELPFRVDRMRRLQLLDRKFDAPTGFDIEKYRRPQMYFPSSRDMRVKLRIAPELARWIREEELSGRMRELADGGLVLHLSVSQPEWIVSWVAAHAGKVEVLSPEALRRRVSEACRRALANYS
jgi:proteasome accessory factor C